MTPRSMVIIHYELFIIHFSPRIAQTSSDYSSTSSTSSKSTQKSFDSTLGLSKTFIEQHIPWPQGLQKSDLEKNGGGIKTKSRVVKRLHRHQNTKRNNHTRKSGLSIDAGHKKKVRFGRGERGLKQKSQAVDRQHDRSRTRRLRHKKRSDLEDLTLKRRLPTLPRENRSTIGVSELNFSVRNGKRWNLTAITT